MIESHLFIAKDMLHGIFIAAAVLILLFGLSYRNEHHNWRILAAHILFAIIVVCFGLYNLFFLASHGVADFAVPRWVMLTCAMAAPVAVMVAHFVFVSSLSIRSYRVYNFLYHFRLGNYFVFAVSLFVFLSIPFLDSYKEISNLILLGFLVPIIGGLVLSVVSIEPNKPQSNVLGIYFTLIFVTVLVSTSFVLYQNLTQVLYVNTASVMITSYVFVFVLLVLGFVFLRYGILEMKHFFSISHLNHFEVIGDLSKAIKNEQFSLYYQPQENLKKGNVVGVEALLRWNHPTKGMMNPNDFFLLAESTGLFETMTKWVTNHALEDIKKMHDAGHLIRMSINFSPNNMRVEQIKYLVDQMALLGIDQHYLTIELTENVMLQRSDERIQDSLALLKCTDIELSLDDFGTGFSSLGYLRDLEVDELKIDASFVWSMFKTTKNSENDNDKRSLLNAQYPPQGKTAAIVKAMVQIAKSLDIQTVAEGVENETQMHTLEDMGCDIIQGYHLSEPKPLDELLCWLNDYSATKISSKKAS